MKAVQCNACGKVIETGARFCPFCGKAQSLECPKCGAQNSQPARFCASCGSPLQGRQGAQVSQRVRGRQPVASLGEIKWLPWLGMVVLIIAGIWAWTLYQPQSTNKTGAGSGGTAFDPALQQEFQRLRGQVELNPKEVKSWIQLGDFFYDTKNYSEAVVYYQHALQLDSTNADVRVDMAICYFQSGQSDQAITELKKSLEFSPNHLNAHYNLGVVYNAEGNRDMAVRYWQKYLTLQPEGEMANQVRSLLAEAVKDSKSQ